MVTGDIFQSKWEPAIPQGQDSKAVHTFYTRLEMQGELTCTEEPLAQLDSSEVAVGPV